MGNTIKIKELKYFGHFLTLFILLVLTALICLTIGSVDISLSEIFAISLGKGNPIFSKIIFEIRLPRILLAIAVGGGLSVAGAVFQSLLMNPLAEPYILGISSGGTFGAILAILLGFSFILVQLFAFTGALSVIILVFFIGKKFGKLEPNLLLLSGVMVGAFLGALILFMITIIGDSLRTAVFWMVGNLALADAKSVLYILPISIFVSFIMALNSHKLNIIVLGEEQATHLGINTNRLKNISYLFISLMVGAIVSVSGIIGFVGLLIPHVCRQIFGSDNRIIIPASFFIGAIYLIITDTISRSLIPPTEIPVGAITAIIGAPAFIFLLKKRFKVTES